MNRQYLNNIYNNVGKQYIKTKDVISRTIDAIDYGNMYFEVKKRISSLNELTEEIDSMFD